MPEFSFHKRTANRVSGESGNSWRARTCERRWMPTKTPISPPAGPIQWFFQGPPAESKVQVVVSP